jgi:hypothetical protein
LGTSPKTLTAPPRPCSPFIVVSLACAVRIDLREILDDLLERSRAARFPCSDRRHVVSKHLEHHHDTVSQIGGLMASLKCCSHRSDY